MSTCFLEKTPFSFPEMGSFAGSFIIMVSFTVDSSFMTGWMEFGGRVVVYRIVVVFYLHEDVGVFCVGDGGGAEKFGGMDLFKRFFEGAFEVGVGIGEEFPEDVGAVIYEHPVDSHYFHGAFGIAPDGGDIGYYLTQVIFYSMEGAVIEDVTMDCGNVGGQAMPASSFFYRVGRGGNVPEDEPGWIKNTIRPIRESGRVGGGSMSCIDRRSCNCAWSLQ